MLVALQGMERDEANWVWWLLALTAMGSSAGSGRSSGEQGRRPDAEELAWMVLTGAADGVDSRGLAGGRAWTCRWRGAGLALAEVLQERCDGGGGRCEQGSRGAC